MFSLLQHYQTTSPFFAVATSMPLSLPLNTPPSSAVAIVHTLIPSLLFRSTKEPEGYMVCLPFFFFVSFSFYSLSFSLCYGGFYSAVLSHFTHCHFCSVLEVLILQFLLFLLQYTISLQSRVKIIDFTFLLLVFYYLRLLLSHLPPILHLLS